jgi:hypothetical protein
MHAPRSTLFAAALVAGLAGAGLAAAQTAPPGQPPPQPQPQQSMPVQPDQPTASKPGFDTLDTNGDGRLTRAEVPADMHDLRTHFRDYDRDHDGKLSPPEYGMYASPPPENMQH